MSDGVERGGGRGDVLVPESGSAHRLLDRLRRGRLVEQEARLVLGDEDRAQTTHQPALLGQFGSSLLYLLGVLPGEVMVALGDVELDEVLSHASTVPPDLVAPKLRNT